MTEADLKIRVTELLENLYRLLPCLAVLLQPGLPVLLLRRL